MRQFPTGVTIILLRTDDGVHGMTANSVTSISVDPPLIMVSLGRTTKMRSHFGKGMGFSVNFLRAEQATVADRFAGRWAWSRLAPELAGASGDGWPTLGGSLATLACRATELIEAGDHTMILGQVIDAKADEGTPLIFYRGRWTSFPSPNDVFLLDRSEFHSAMQAAIDIDLDRTALLMIEMTDRHLDPDRAHMPLPPFIAKNVVAATVPVLEFMRDKDRPVIHAFMKKTLRYPLHNPFHAALRRVKASPIPWTDIINSDVPPEIVSELAPRSGEYVLERKTRPSAFHGTRLAALLKELRIDTLLVAGVPTNTAILHTVMDAFSLDLKVVVLSDCVASIHGNDLHELALRDIEFCFGWVIDSKQLFALAGANDNAAETRPAVEVSQ